MKINVQITPHAWPKTDGRRCLLKFFYKGFEIEIIEKRLSWDVSDTNPIIYSETWEILWSAANSHYYSGDSVQECFEEAIAYIDREYPDPSVISFKQITHAHSADIDIEGDINIEDLPF